MSELMSEEIGISNTHDSLKLPSETYSEFSFPRFF
jgi:hypothetical protein